ENKVRTFRNNHKKAHELRRIFEGLDKALLLLWLNNTHLHKLFQTGSLNGPGCAQFLPVEDDLAYLHLVLVGNKDGVTAIFLADHIRSNLFNCLLIKVEVSL